jgi:hypothetical protein
VPDTGFLSNNKYIPVAGSRHRTGQRIVVSVDDDIPWGYICCEVGFQLLAVRHHSKMPLEIRQVEKGDIAKIAQLDQIAMRDYGVHHTIEKVQKEEGVDITYSFERWISSGMEHHAQTFWKVVDSETDELVSVAKFTFQYHKGEAYQDTPVEGEKPPPKRLLDFFAWLNKRSEAIAKEHYTGTPHACT